MTEQELIAELAETKRAHALMSAQFTVMQREKEHGWREAERWEGRAKKLEADLAALTHADTSDH